MINKTAIKTAISRARKNLRTRDRIAHSSTVSLHTMIELGRMVPDPMPGVDPADVEPVVNEMIALLADSDGYVRPKPRINKAAIMRSMGLVPVRGAVSGKLYWE